MQPLTCRHDESVCKTILDVNRNRKETGSFKNLKKTLVYFGKMGYNVQVRYSGPLVKRSRRDPLTVESGVRFPWGSAYLKPLKKVEGFQC